MTASPKTLIAIDEIPGLVGTTVGTCVATGSAVSATICPTACSEP